MTKYLYLPLEIVIREQDGKTILACEAAANGWTAIVGPKLHLYAIADQLPEGVFLIKSATPSELGQIKELKSYGHKVCSLDEEGFVTHKEYMVNNVRYNNETIDEIEKIFLWGNEQYKAFINEMPPMKDKAFVTGNSRFEFWQKYARQSYGSEVKAIREKYGRFILIPSSFGVGNNILGREQGVQLSVDQSLGLSERVAYFYGIEADQNYLAFKEYMEFLPEAAARFPDINFIVRPHPSESPEVWKKLAEKVPNLHMEYEGAVTSWVLASAAVLHFCSTTSIEARLMGKAAINYRPMMAEYMDSFYLELPMAVSDTVRMREDVVKLIAEAIALPEDHIKDSSDVYDKISNWISCNTDKSSAEKILEQLSPLAPTPVRALAEPQLSLRHKARKIFDDFLCVVYNTPLNKLFTAKLEGRVKAVMYGQRKYMGVDLNHTKTVVDVFSGISSKAGGKLNVSAFTSTLFTIRQET